MSLGPVAVSSTQSDTPPHTPLVRGRRAARDAEPMPERRGAPDSVRDAAPHTGVSERTLKSQSSNDTNPDWIFDHVDGSGSSHVSTPSLDIPDRSTTPGLLSAGLAAPQKSGARRQSPLTSLLHPATPGGLPCRDLEQSWAHTPESLTPGAGAPEWDVFSYASSDSVPSTPVRGASTRQHTPLAVRLVHSGAGHLSVVRPEHTDEEAVYREVGPATTHLSMKGCALPASLFDVLLVPMALVVLDLSGTGLDRLPAPLRHCPTLEELNVSANPLAAPAHWAPLAALPALRVLLADDCGLAALPLELRDTRQLRVLGVRANHLTHLPSWLHVLDKLECLLLDGNDALSPAWRAVLAPLLEPAAPPEQSPTTGEARRGLLHRALRWGAPRRADRDERAARAAARAPTPVRWTPDKGAEASTTDSLRVSPKSIVTAIPNASPATHSPLPPPGRGARSGSGPRTPPTSAESAAAATVACFLPVHAAPDGEAPRAVQSSAYVRDLLGYLADLDDLRTERHVVTCAVRLAVPRSPGTPSTPGTPLWNGLAPFHMDTTPSTTVSPVTPAEEQPQDSPFVPAEPERIKEDGRRRQRLIGEIVETERTYVANLTELMEIYVKRARQPLDGHPDERVLPIAKERAVFGHIEGIVHFHAHAFLPSLEQAAAPALHGAADARATAETAARVANVFTQHAAYFKMYMNYVNQYDSAVRRIARWSQPLPARARSGPKAAIENAGVTLASLGHRLTLNQHESELVSRHVAEDWEVLSAARRRQIQSYLARCREDPRHSQLNLEGYLLLPIQRIPRYRMLLEQLVRCTSSELLAREDLDAIPRALAHVSLVASWVNEGKRQSEQGRRLLLWQSKLRGSFSAPLVQPHRRLVCDGPLRLRRVARRTDAQAPSEAAVLEQTTMDQRVQLLLCNDLAAVVADPRDAHDDAHAHEPTEPVAPLEPADVEAVDLLAVLKPCVRHAAASAALVPPASVLGGVVVRVVDARYIFYFTANSPREARQWADAINAQPGG